MIKVTLRNLELLPNVAKYRKQILYVVLLILVLVVVALQQRSTLKCSTFEKSIQRYD